MLRHTILLAPLVTFTSPQDPAPASKPRPERLTEIVTSATKRDEKVFDVPHMVHVIDGDDARKRLLASKLVTSTAEIPGVLPQKTSGGLGSPFLRGFGGYNTLLLVDGIRLNSSVQRSGPSLWQSTIDTFSARGIEIVMGPGSVLHGSDAIGGTINILTKKREEYQPGVHVNGLAFFRFDSASKSWMERAELSANVGGTLGLQLGMTQKDYGNVRAGGMTGLQENTDFTDTDGDMRVDLRLDPEWTFTSVYQHVDQDDIPRTSQTIFGKSFFGTAVGNELRRDESFTRDLLYGRFERKDRGESLDREQYTVWWNRQQQLLNRDPVGVNFDHSGADSQSTGASFQIDRETSLGTFTGGVEYVHDFIESFKNNYKVGGATTHDVQGPSGDNAGADYLGVYLQDSVRAGSFEFLPGVRYTFARASADQVDNPLVGGALVTTPGNIIKVDDEWHSLTGSFRALYHVSEDFNIFGGVSQGFRAPTVGDLTEFQTNTVVSQPTPNLDPEYYLQEEIGLKARGDIFDFQLSYWLTQIKDSIVTAPTGATVGTTPVVTKKNVGDGWVNGVDAMGSVQLTDVLSARAAVSWMEGYVDEIILPAGTVERNHISRAQPLTGYAALRYQPTSKKAYVEVAVKGAQRQDLLSRRDKTDTQRIPPGGTPGWLTVDLRAGISIGKNASITGALENITNENYRIHGSGINEPGFNAVVGLEIRF